jgi:hypothetical protein
MNTSIRILAGVFCTYWLIGCAVNFQPPPLPATNPASVEAKESVTPAARPMLGRDALTQKTNERLAATAPGNPSFHPPEMEQMHHGMSGMEGIQQHDKTGTATMNPSDKPMSGKAYYTCKMHPQIHQDKLGKCPICDLTLIQKEEERK